MTVPAALPQPKPTSDEVREIVRVWATEQLTFRQLGDRFGRTKESVKGIVCRNRHMAAAMVEERGRGVPEAPRVWVQVVPDDEIVQRRVVDDVGAEHLVSLPRLRFLEGPEPV